MVCFHRALKPMEEKTWAENYLPKIYGFLGHALEYHGEEKPLLQLYLNPVIWATYLKFLMGRGVANPS